MEHPPPDAAAMFQRHCTSLDSVRCFLDLFPVLRSLPKITAVRQQMERQDDSKCSHAGKTNMFSPDGLTQLLSGLKC